MQSQSGGAPPPKLTQDNSQSPRGGCAVALAGVSFLTLLPPRTRFRCVWGVAALGRGNLSAGSSPSACTGAVSLPLWRGHMAKRTPVPAPQLTP